MLSYFFVYLYQKATTSMKQYKCQIKNYEDWTYSGWKTFFTTTSHRKAKNALWLAKKENELYNCEFRIIEKNT